MNLGNVGLALLPAAFSLAAVSIYVLADEYACEGTRGFRISARWSAVLVSALAILTTAVAQAQGADSKLFELGIVILALMCLMFAMFVGLRALVVQSYLTLRANSQGIATPQENAARTERLRDVRRADRAIFAMVLGCIALSGVYVVAVIGG